MGNAASVKLVFDDENEANHDEHTQKVVKAGEPLMGTMIVETNKSISNARPYLFLIGKEKCREKRTLSTIFLQIQLPLAEIPNALLTPGRYEFPFLIDLPATMPRSFEFVRSPNSCKIKYYIEAQLRQGRKVRRYLFVDSAPTIPSDPVPFLGHPVTRDAALLSPRGTLSFAGYVVDTRLGRGQTMEICVAGRNDSNVEIKGIRIKMIETVIFSAHGAINRTNTTGPPAVPPASYKVTLVQFPDVPPFEGMQKKSTLGVLKARHEGFSPRREHYNAIRNELLARENVIRVKIPKYAKDTFRGQTLECRHHLEVQIVVASFGVTPLITIPLSIGNPQEPTGPQIAIAVPSAPPAPLEEIDIPVEPSAPELFEQESNNYPIAVAVQLQPMDMRGISTRTPIAVAQSNAFIIGTHAVVVNNYDDNDEEQDGDYDNASLQETLLEVMPARIPRTPTFENLLQEMVSSVQDYDIISRKLADSAWMPIFSSLTPSQYGTIILHVNVAFDQPKVAVLVATSFDKESHPFTCEFLLEAVRNTEEWNRTVMVQKLLPLCTDLALGHNTIRNELNEWEQVVTLSSFEQAMDAR